MGTASSIAAGLGLGVAYDSIIINFNETLACFTSCDSWVLKAEKSLTYVGFMMGASKPGEVIFYGMHSLLNRVSMGFWNMPFDNNHWLVQGVESILSFLGQRQLKDIWEYVRDKSLCMRFYNCPDAFLIWLTEQKMTWCRVRRCREDWYVGRKLSLCEQLFNDSPLIILTLIMFVLFCLSVFAVAQTRRVGNGPGPGGPSPPGTPPVTPPVTLPVTRPLTLPVTPPVTRPVTRPATPPPPPPPPRPPTQRVNAFCPLCNRSFTYDLLNPTPIYCSIECSKPHSKSNNKPSPKPKPKSPEPGPKAGPKPPKSSKLEKVIQAKIQENMTKLLDEVKKHLCPECRRRFEEQCKKDNTTKTTTNNSGTNAGNPAPVMCPECGHIIHRQSPSVRDRNRDNILIYR